jgi:two-component system, sporulation sensor kinase E
MKPGQAQKTGIDGSEVFDRMRSYWLSNVVHGLSGALFAARGYLRMVLEGSPGVLLEPQRRYLTTSLENVERIIILTQELNDFPGKDWFEFDTIAIRDLLRQSVAEVSATHPGVQVLEEIEGGILTTIGDAGKLGLAMKTLLAQAFEFTGSGGAVQITAREEDDKINLKFSASSLATPEGKPSPDVSLACKILRFHGGSAYLPPAGKTLSEEYVVTCELPVIRLTES